MQTPSFGDLNLPQWLQDNIEAVGYTAPTPVQAEAIPLVLSGVDVVAQAQTGTGKTAAFAIPLLASLKPEDGPVQVVILGPTRELTRQISEEFHNLGRDSGIVTATVYGGVAFEPQLEAFKNAQVIVATPGRLLDHLRRGSVNFKNLRVFGFDEADEMLSMGFEREVTEIMSFLPEERQNLLFSATMPHDVMRFADNFLTEAERLNLSSDSVGATSVKHLAYYIDGSMRVAALRALLRSRTVRGAIIFANTRAETFRVTALLEEEGYSVGVLNGEMAQRDRERTLTKLKSESLDFLVATDIAARGIDISWLRAVINYEMPDNAETYIHRTGRTGRAGQLGTAYSFITPGDVSCIHQLEKFFSIRFVASELPDRRQVRQARADEELGRLLEPLNEDRSLDYGRYLALARRLSETEEGPRTIAKLIALYESPATAALTRNVTAETSAEESAKVTDAKVSGPGRDEDNADKPQTTREDSRDAKTEDRRKATPSRDDKDAAIQRDDVPSKHSAKAQRDDREEDSSGDHEDRDAATSERQSEHTGETIAAWIAENSRPDNKCRSAHAVAKALELSEEEVDRLADDFDGLVRTGGRRNLWKVVDEEILEEAGVPIDSDDDDDRDRSGDNDKAEKDDRGSKKGRSSKRDDDRDDDRRSSRKDDDRDDNKKAKDSKKGRSNKRGDSDKKSDKKSRTGSQRPDRDRQWVALRVNVGSDSFDDPQSFIEWFAEFAGFDAEDIKGADLRGKHAVVDVDESYWRDFIEAVHNQKWEGRQVHVHRAR